MEDEKSAPPDDLRRYRRQRAMQYLECAINESCQALERITSQEHNPFGPAISLAYALEHSRASLLVISNAAILPLQAEAWLDEHGESVRLFRNRVDHYDEDVESKSDLKSQVEYSMGLVIEDGKTVHIRGKSRRFSLEALRAYNDLVGVMEELVNLGFNNWDTPL